MSYRYPESDISEESDDEESVDYYDDDYKETIYDKDINEDHIIELLNDNNYEEIKKLFKCGATSNYTYYLYKYCKDKNSIKILNLLHKIYDINTIDRNDSSLAYFDIGKCNNDFICEFLKIVNLNDSVIKKLFSSAISYNNISMVKLLESMGYNFDHENHHGLIVYGKDEIFNYIIPVDCYQEIFDEWYNSQHYTYSNISLDRLKYLVNMGVDITKNLEKLIICGICNKNIDVIKFCYELFNKTTPEMLHKSVYYDNYDALNYFLDQGADINLLNPEDFKYSKDTKLIKILANNNYKHNNVVLGKIFKYCIIDKDINDVMEAFNYVNFDYILEMEKYYVDNYPDKEKYGCMQFSLPQGEHFMCIYVLSAFEYVVHMNKIEHMKFIIKHCGNKLDINKLFIIAVANNRLEIANMLLDVNDNVDFNTAMECACFFGHYDMVKYLLKFNVDFNPILMDMCVNGSNYRIKKTMYQVILKKVNILNDIFYYGNKHNMIIEFLIKNNINFTIESFEKFNFDKYTLDIVKQLLNDGYNDYEIFKICATFRHFPGKHDYNVTCDIPKNLLEIMEYLLKLGVNPNVDNVINDNVKKLLENYL